MELSLDRTTIHAVLEKLASCDKEFRLFGANAHCYKLNPPIAEVEISQFERETNVSLPADYRHFITRIGNGGAGPEYGVFKFGEHDSNHHFCKWDRGHLVGDFSKPFRFSQPWNHTAEFWDKKPHIDDETPDDEVDRLWEEWDKLLEAEYWNPSVMDGAIPICHLGCAYRQWLVINGEQRGFVWNDDRADDRGLSPVLDSYNKPMTFGDWYLAWLSQAMVEVKPA